MEIVCHTRPATRCESFCISQLPENGTHLCSVTRTRPAHLRYRNHSAGRPDCSAADDKRCVVGLNREHVHVVVSTALRSYAHCVTALGTHFALHTMTFERGPE